MPVELRTLRGKVDHDVEIALRDLTAAVNQLEGSASVATMARLHDGLAAVQRDLDVLTQRFDDLARRVAALENP